MVAEDICLSHGESEFLYDMKGNRYIDYVAGIAVNALGHNHPALVRAISNRPNDDPRIEPLLYAEQADLGEASLRSVPSRWRSPCSSTAAPRRTRRR